MRCPPIPVARLRPAALALLALSAAFCAFPAIAQSEAQPRWVLAGQWHNQAAQAYDEASTARPGAAGQGLGYLFRADDLQAETISEAEPRTASRPGHESLCATLHCGWSSPPASLSPGDDVALTFRRTWAVTSDSRAGMAPRLPWVLEFAALAVWGPDGKLGRLTRARAISQLAEDNTQQVWRMPKQNEEEGAVLLLAGISTASGRRLTNCWLYRPEGAKDCAPLPDLEQIGASLAFIPRRGQVAAPVLAEPEQTPTVVPCAVATTPPPSPVPVCMPLYKHPQARWQLAPGSGWTVQPDANNDTLLNPSENLRLVIWRQSLPFAGGAFPVLENEVNGWLAAYPDAKPKYVELGALPAMQCALPSGDGYLLSFCVGQRLYRAWGLPAMATDKPVNCALALQVMQTLRAEP